MALVVQRAQQFQDTIYEPMLSSVNLYSIAHLQSNSPAAAAAIPNHDTFHEFKGFV
jgi:hypothetical protein